MEGYVNQVTFPIFCNDQSLFPIQDYLREIETVMRKLKRMMNLLLLIIKSILRIIYNKMTELNTRIQKQENYELKFDDPDPPSKQITLDQPVIVTLKRDLQMIILKLRYAMIPSLRETGRRQLLNWDLWGPFLLTLLLSCTLSFRTQKQASTIITSIFFVMWVGSLVVYLNASFLGSEMSFFQSACMLGYCLFPLNVVSLITMLIGKFIPAPIKLTLVGISFIWATLSSIAFLGELVPERKKKLALYPVCLFYLFLSWFVLIV